MTNKVIIIYSSKHHGNTFKLVHAISNAYNIDIVDVSKVNHNDLSQYDIIGFASGIDFGRFYEDIETFTKKYLPINKKVFFIYTCARTNTSFANSMKAVALSRNAIVLGEFGCKGYNTYGPWKIIGGMNKNHPNEDDIKLAIDFCERIINNNL